MQKVDEASHKSLKKILRDNFIGGIAWGLGVTVGVSIILAIGSFLIARIDYVPIIGSFIVDIVNFVQNNNPNL